MNDNPSPSEAQDLDALFRSEPGSGTSLDDVARTLAGDILDMAEDGIPADPRFYHRLEQELRTAALSRHKARRSVWLRVFASMAGAAVLLVLLFLSAPRIHQMLGQPEPAATIPAAPGPSILRMTATPQQEQKATLQPEQAPTPTLESTPAPEQAAGWVLQANLPSGPDSVPGYIQVPPGEPLTPQSALAMATRLGISGALYQFQGEGGGTTYLVSDGRQSALFWGATSAEFTYSSAHIQREAQGSFSFEQRAAAAREWLQARGLLPEQAEILPQLTDPDGLGVYQRLEGGRLYDPNAYSPPIHMKVDAAGQVTMLIYHPLQLDIIGNLQLRSAQEAWEALVNGRTGGLAYYQTLSYEQQRSLKQWFRTYQPGEQVDLYGYAQTIQAVDPAQPPMVSVGNLTVLGGPDLLRQIPMRHYLHVWGTYQEDAQGFAWLDLHGSEQVDDLEVHLTGELVQENGVGLFKTDQGDFFTVPDLPAEIPDGIKVDINGARLLSGDIHWQAIQTHSDQMDQNQQFGMLPLGLLPQMEVAGPPQTGHQPGDRIEALVGLSRNIVYQEADGTQTLERYLEVSDPDGAEPMPWQARLDGSGAAGAENYQNLRIRVWGTYQLDGIQPVIEVERLEPVDPDLHITPWFGKVSEATLDGKPVLLLTLDSGQQWVLKSSIRFSMSLASNGWETGADLAVEGYPSLNPASLGGLSVLEDMSIALLNNRSPGHSRDNYQPYMNRPAQEVREVNQPGLPAGGTVENVELVYFANSFQGGLPAEEEPRLLQPLWRFSGHLPDGRPFELLLPAARKDTPN